ncbi:hypothetical protein RB195_005278 [Necator americanus]|uniref:Uncharacterized protein n=1 Tax=Necator americanus TaxID=51031 RepID=A0ABR1BM26_NECAM
MVVFQSTVYTTFYNCDNPKFYLETFAGSEHPSPAFLECPADSAAVTVKTTFYVTKGTLQEAISITQTAILVVNADRRLKSIFNLAK